MINLCCEIIGPDQAMFLPNELVECESTIDYGGERYQVGHVGVHFRIHEPKGDGLVTHKCLIMTFNVGDCGFQMSPISQCIANVSHTPVFVLRIKTTRVQNAYPLLLEQSYPHIWDSHG